MASKNKNGLSTVQKVVLSTLVVFLLFMLLGAMLSGDIFAALVCANFAVVIVCILLGKIDKKYTWPIVGTGLVLFFIAAALSNGDNNTKKEKAVASEQTITDKTTFQNEAKNKEDKVKEESNSIKELSQKEKEVAETGTKQGTQFGMAGAFADGFSDMVDMADYVEGMEDKINEILEDMAGGEYDKMYGAPTNAEEKKLKKIYIEHFIEAMNNTMDAMDTMEKLGKKR